MEPVLRKRHGFFYMNKQRRKTIDLIRAALDEQREHLEQVRDDEQEAYDNLPEAIQAGATGEKAQEAITALGDAVSSLEQISADLETALE
jgi:hypothetical protein